MKTLSVSVPDADFAGLGLKSTTFTFAELMDIIRRETARKLLRETVALAEEHGLSGMTMDEIDAEVRAVRESHAKGDS